MKVAVLMGWIQYEGDVLLGVYSSRQKAIAAAQAKFASSLPYEEAQYDGYVIEYRATDGIATTGFLHNEVEREDITEAVTSILV